MKIFRKGVDSIDDAKKEIKKHGEFHYEYGLWVEIRVTPEKLMIDRVDVNSPDGCITYCYSNVHGTYGFPVVIE